MNMESESSSPEEVKVDFYEDEYDKAYEEKPSFNSYKPVLAGLLLITPTTLGFILSCMDLFSRAITVGGLIGFIILAAIEMTIIFAGLCSLKKVKHRFALFGAVVSFVFPYNNFALLGIVIETFDITVHIDNAGLVLFLGFTLMPILAIYFIFTSDDEFTSKKFTLF